LNLASSDYSISKITCDRSILNLVRICLYYKIQIENTLFTRWGFRLYFFNFHRINLLFVLISTKKLECSAKTFINSSISGIFTSIPERKTYVKTFFGLSMHHQRLYRRLRSRMNLPLIEWFRLGNLIA
jgi:hypothetical protein